MRNRARWAVAAAAVTATSPLVLATAAPAGAATVAAAATQPGCPTATGLRITDTPETFRKTVALTFDDGPNPLWTPQILAVLAKHHVHGTFFVVGKNADLYPEILQQVIDAGHVVGNHTWDHPTVKRDMYDLTAAELVTEFDPNTAMIRDATGLPVCFFRAPQGKDHTPMIRQLAKNRGQMVVGFYSASDYQQPHHADPTWVTRITQRLEDQGSHPILLLHDGGSYRGNSVEALDKIITWYADRGYIFTDPAGRPFPGDLPAGAKVPATGWAVPPGWTPPDDFVIAPQPTDLPTFRTPADDPTATTTPTFSTDTPTGATTSRYPLPTIPIPTGTGTTSRGPAPVDDAPSIRPVTKNRRLARLAANSAENPLAARKLTDAVARYLMIFSAPPA